MQTLNLGPVSELGRPIKRHILLAEDEPNAQLAISLTLKKAGHKVTVVENGLEALRQIKELREKNESFDLLLTDIEMPYLNGLGLIDEINGLNVSLPVIVITGYGNKAMVEELMRKGCSEFLDKPFEPEDLKKRVSMVFEKEARLQASKGKRLRKIEQDKAKLSSEVEAYRHKLQTLRDQIDSAVGTYKNIIEINKNNYKVRVAYRSQPLKDLGGDFFGIQNTRNGCNILIADVAGHDMSASYHSLVIKTLFDDRCHDEIDGLSFFRILNTLLLQYHRSERLITGLFLCLNLEAMQGHVVSAAHPPLLKIRPSRPNASPIYTTGDILGIHEQVNFDMRTFPIKPGDRLILYTDGITDSYRVEGRPGARKKCEANKLYDSITSYFQLPLEDMIEHIWQKIVPFYRHKFRDDMLLVGLEIP